MASNRSRSDVQPTTLHRPRNRSGTRPIRSILVANRGEIARRVLRSARSMGIETVAVHSDPDVREPHVMEADRAFALGGTTSAESYLVAERIIAIAREAGVDAVHPGYGFLSENAAFVEALEAADIRFIGPPASAIAAMGDKIRSKALAIEAGVNTVPGFVGEIEGDEGALEAAESIGFPVMIKASAGGGGKGMRIVRDRSEVVSALRAARSEARSSFSDERVLMERYVERPRHVEIQILADAHGTCVHLGERECSIQRRHQKVIEEAPSPALTDELRQRMGAQAVALARAVGYVSAGTVEFILDPSGEFFFLEMNTRLQVEHPVTECVYGIDLVEAMIRVGEGEPLWFGQEDVAASGHAIEARIYAEDPQRGFLPSIGRLTRYREPGTVVPGVRVDSGVYEGSEISMFYDPMIAKLIVHRPTREDAVASLGEALDAFEIRGPGHNMAFLSAILGLSAFIDGDLATDFIDRHFPDGFSGVVPDDETRRRLIAVAAHVDRLSRRRRLQAVNGSASEAEEASSSVDPAARPSETRVVQVDRAFHPVTVTPTPGGSLLDDENGAIAVESPWRLGERLFVGVVAGRRMIVQVEARGSRLHLWHRGVRCVVRVLTPATAELASLMPEKRPPDLSRFLLSPMPGLLVSLAVVPGDSVKAGQELAVVEAMKMENILRAEQDGTIASLHAEPGDSLSVDDPIIEFEEAGADK